jgi:LacI family transcriptional regulator
MNLEDIAKKTGVSRSTVSRVINNSPNVNSETRERVLLAIEQLGYTPNPAARTLVTQRTQVIGVVIPHVPGFFFGNALYYPLVLQGIAEATDNRDYAMLLWLQDNLLDENRFYRRILRNRMMDGLIIAAPEENPHFIDQLHQLGIPFVMIDRPSEQNPHASYVGINNQEAAQTAVHHLIQLGRQRIGTITGISKNVEAIERVLGYRQALREAGLAVDERYVVEGSFDEPSGYAGALKLIQLGVDAIFCANDQTAFGAMKAISEKGLRIPEDIAVIGMDDLPGASMSVPPLTTIRQHVKLRGHQAVALLLQHIEAQVAMPFFSEIPYELVIRESTVGELAQRPEGQSAPVLDAQ